MLYPLPMRSESECLQLIQIVSNIGVVVVVLVPLHKFATVLNLCAGLIANIVYKCINIGVGMLYVARLHGQQCAFGFGQVLSSTSIKRNSGVGCCCQCCTR